MIDSNKDCSGASFRGSPVKKPTVVDTVDCCCIIVHSSLVKKYGLRFDENLSFDLYSEDFSISANEKYGVKTKVFPIMTHHYSYGTIDTRFLLQLQYLNKKYEDSPNVYVTSTAHAIGSSIKLIKVNKILRARNRIPFRWLFYKKVSHKGWLTVRILGIPIWRRQAYSMEAWHKGEMLRHDKRY